jgi:hypothetical protein
MKKQHQNVQFTKIKIKPDKDIPIPDLGNHEDIPTNAANPKTTNNQQKEKPKKMHNMYIQIHNATNTAHSDQTGCFPVISSSGNKYIMVLVEINGNFIDAEPMKNKTAGSMVKAYLVLWNQLTASGTVKPTTHLLDNKALEEFKAVLRKNCTIQLVPPDNHQQNLAEQVIQTFKNHFKAILAGVDDSFPMRLWNKLLPQTILTLFLSVQCCTNSLGMANVHGPFDYDKIPLVLMRCAVQIHKSSEQQGTWAANTIDGWYLQTSPEHYQCHQLYVKKTKSERISDTVFFQTQILNSTNCDPSGFDCQSSWRLNIIS